MPSLPQNNVWAQVSDRDVFDSQKFGSLIATSGIDLSSNHGRLRLGVRLILNMNTDDLGDISAVPVGFWLCGTGIYTIMGNGTTGYALVNDGTPYGTFARSTAGTEPTKVNSATSDGIFANNKLYVSELDGGTVYLCKKVGDTDWGSRISMQLDAGGYPHMLFAGLGRVFMTNNQSCVISMDSAESVATSGANTIILNGISADFTNIITRPFLSGETFWLPCINSMGGRGYVYEWDGSSTTFQRKHELKCPGAVSGCDLDDVPYIMDVYGNLRAFNGSVFKKVASLYRKNGKLLYNSLSLTNLRWMHPNGMFVKNSRIRMIIDNRNNDNTYSIEETITAGEYEYDPEHPEYGIYNVALFGQSKSSNQITEYGALRIAGAGGGAEIDLPSTSASRNGAHMAGCGYYIDDSSVKYGIFYDDSNDTLQKAGSFITLKFSSSGIKDAWNFVRLLHSELKDTSDLIVSKFRTTEEDAVEATITWTDETHFTVLNSAIDLTDYFDDGNDHGKEVEIIHGVGANRCMHIVDAELSAGTWTVEVDQTYILATGTAKARFSKWTWLAEQTFDNDETCLNMAPGEDASWIQFKFYCMWKGKREIERLITDEASLKPTNISN